jgi:hypothetical protein
VQGTNAWVARILGVEQIAPGGYALHWRTDQTTTWATGDGTWDCLAGTVTRWREDYWFVNDLPGPDGPAKGLKHTMGGSLDANGNYDGSANNWDIWFDRWTPLPDPVHGRARG